MVFRGGEVTAGTTNQCDVVVALELTDTGGLSIEIKGSAAIPADKVSKIVEEIMDEQGISDARILLNLNGTEKFALRARLETAACRALRRKDKEAR